MQNNNLFLGYYLLVGILFLCELQTYFCPIPFEKVDPLFPPSNRQEPAGGEGLTWGGVRGTCPLLRMDTLG